MSKQTRHWNNRAQPYSLRADVLSARRKITKARKNPCTTPKRMMWEARSCLMGMLSRMVSRLSILFWRIVLYLFRALQKHPYDLQGTVHFGVDVPFDKGNLPPFQFDAGDATGVHAAAVVEKWQLSRFRETGPMGMARDGDQEVPAHDPAFDPSFDPDEFLIVLGGVGGVGNAPYLQGFPKYPHQKAVESPKAVVPPIGLVTMGAEELLPRFPVL